MFKLCQSIIIVWFIVTLIVGVCLLYQHESYDNSDFVKEGTNGETCDDFIFGCCKIYDTCQIVNNTLFSTSLDLDPTKAVCEDEKCKNCPRLKDIILYYNDYMENVVEDQICENNEWFGYYPSQTKGCSRIITACDTRYYYDVVMDDMDNGILEANPHYFTNLYLHQSRPSSILNANVYKLYSDSDTTIADIWAFYNNIYDPEKKFKVNIVGYFICITLFTIACTCFNCLINNSKDQNYVKTQNSDVSLP